MTVTLRFNKISSKDLWFISKFVEINHLDCEVILEDEKIQEFQSE